MPKSPFFTVIIPCYNYGQFLAEAIQSVSKQDFDDWECIIVDDGSTDHTAQVATSLAQVDARIKYVFQKNAGLSNARNTGLQMARGQYVQFLDADDYIEHSKLSYFAKYISGNSLGDIYYAEGQLFTDQAERNFFDNYLGMEQAQWTLSTSGQGESIIAEFLKSNRFLVNMPIIKTELARQMGFKEYHENINIWPQAQKSQFKELFEKVKGNEDWDFWIRAAIAGAYFQQLPSKDNTRSMLRIHQGSMSTKTLAMMSSQMLFRYCWNEAISSQPLKNQNAKILQLNMLNVGILLKKAGEKSFGNAVLKAAVKSFKDFKYTSFSAVSMLLSGEQADKLQRYVTGQHKFTPPTPSLSDASNP